MIDAKTILREVKENHARLSSCGYHNFSIDLTPDRPIGKKYRCTVCGGEVTAEAKRWYDEGIEHGRNN